LVGGTWTIVLELDGARSNVPLTAREQEVLSWVARGKTNTEIARLLRVAPSTVRKHLENVYVKMGVHNRTTAVARLLGLNALLFGATPII
jgi:DNA-binding CsgD family transcriptional regulator